MAEHKITEFSAGAGCAAKIGPGVLQSITAALPRYETPKLLVGFDACDDACAYDLGDGRLLLQTVDFFPPMVEDPETFGRIAAANALSDIWAMGGEPALALNILCIPGCLTAQQVRAILRGGHEKAAEAGVVIAGGHSIEDAGPKYGLCVTGFCQKEKLWCNAGARPGDALVLTKPLGTGVLLTANRAGLLEKADYELLAGNLTRLNRDAKRAAEALDVHACTDVTGFSLLGHGREMAEASGVTLRFRAGDIPRYAAARDFCEMGLVPAGAYRNRDFLQDKVSLSPALPRWLADVLFDPQTSGGLLLALPQEQAARLPYPVVGKAEPKGAYPVVVEA